MQPEDFAAKFAVSRETIERLTIYESLLIQWGQTLSLVGRATLNDVWERHFADSAQIYNFAKTPLIDLGTGAGFPGMVLAIMGLGAVHLADNNQKKIEFLHEVAKATQTAITIHNCKAEAVPDTGFATITARALAPLDDLLKISARLFQPGTQAVFLKGKAHGAELETARRNWNFDCRVTPSATNAESAILTITKLQKTDRRMSENTFVIATPDLIRGRQSRLKATAIARSNLVWIASLFARNDAGKAGRFMCPPLALMALLFPTIAHADIPLGLAGPFTGPEASFGQEMRAGADLAVADINAAGGVLGQKITIVEGDDQCDPKQAVTVANQMVTKNVSAVIGHFCSGSSIPASDVYAEESMLQITPISSSPALTEGGKKNVFRLYGRDDEEGQVAAAYLATHFAGKKIAIVDDKQTFGAALAKFTRAALTEKGVTETLDDTLNPGEKDYSALVTKLKQANIDVLYYAGLPNEAGLLARQMRAADMKTRLMASDGIQGWDFWKIAGDAGADTLMSAPPDTTKDPKNAALIARLKQATGVIPENYTLHCYAAIQVWAQAVKAAGSTDIAKMETALRSGSFDTVIGKVGFDAKGDMNSPGYVMYEWQNGTYAVLPEGK